MLAAGKPSCFPEEKSGEALYAGAIHRHCLAGLSLRLPPPFKVEVSSLALVAKGTISRVRWDRQEPARG
jgi:hypothetical protein